MRTTFATNFYCRNSKRTATNVSPVELSIIINGERKFINLPWKENPEEFNKKRQPQHIQNLVREWNKKIDECIADLLAEGTPLTVDTLRESLRTGGTRSYTIRNCFEEYLKTLKKRVGIDMTHGAYRKYELTMELFFKYTNPDNEITTVTPALISDFYADLNRSYQPNSSASYMAKTKTFIKYAMDNGKLKINPFQSVKVKREKKQIEYLTEEEIEKIINTPMSTTALERVRDTFVLQIFCGLAYVDMEALKEEDIKENNGVYYIEKKRVKTGIPYTAVILPKGVEMLKKYNFKMPIISNQKTNSALKAIARECGIDRNIYSHIGRKTYGNLLLNGYKDIKPVSLEVTAMCLGHSNPKTTLKYYASVHTETVLEAFR